MHGRSSFLVLIVSLFMNASVLSQRINIYDRPVQVERNRTYDALHYRVELHVDLNRKYFSGKNTITLSPLNSGFNIIALDAREMKVLSVTDDAQRLTPFEQSDSSVRISLHRQYSVGENITLTVHYECLNPSHGLLFDDENAQWPQMVSSDSWPNHARHWFPCYDWPNDKATQEVIVTVNEGLKVLSNGRLVKVTPNDTNRTITYHWSMDQPHATYLSMLAIAPFTVIKDSLGPLPINYWVYRQDDAVAREIFAVTPSVVSFFNTLYRYPYPWAKYDQVIGPREGGGAEATSATILGLGAVRHKRPDQDYDWERIIAHEAAHQWWGDLITLRSWEHTWLNESFATYSDYLYTCYKRGAEEGALDLEGKKSQYLREAQSKYLRPIVFHRYNRIEENFDRHTYQKGAAVLHILRYHLGDEGFFRTLSYFLHRHAFQSVETNDFARAIKEVTGINMDWFFDQYIYKPGHPILDVSYQYYPDAQTIKVRVVQKQDTAFGVPLYRFPVRIGITIPGRQWVEELWVSRLDETFELRSKTKPLLVRFDEGNYLLKEISFKKELSELFYQLEHDDVIGRIWAVSQLVELQRDPQVRKALETSSRTDPSPAVRKAALNAVQRALEKK